MLGSWWVVHVEFCSVRNPVSLLLLRIDCVISHCWSDDRWIQAARQSQTLSILKHKRIRIMYFCSYSETYCLSPYFCSIQLTDNVTVIIINEFVIFSFSKGRSVIFCCFTVKTSCFSKRIRYWYVNLLQLLIIVVKTKTYKSCFFHNLWVISFLYLKYPPTVKMHSIIIFRLLSYSMIPDTSLFIIGIWYILSGGYPLWYICKFHPQKINI